MMDVVYTAEEMDFLVKAAEHFREKSHLYVGSYFELIDPQQHYDHIVCTECGKVTLMVDACPVEKHERTIEKRYGYSELRHTLEFFGKCPECR